MLTVIVPVLNEIKITDDFLATIRANSVLPDEIILIDNGSTEDIKSLVTKYPELNIVYVRHEENIGVNAAWNEGFRLANNDIISVLNNDLLLDHHFFKKILATMKYPNVGMCVPITVTRDAPPSLDEPVALRDMTRREGWAFTIRRDIVADNPIPTELKIWYGDDFLYTLAGNRGYDRVMMVNNPVFHYGSVTMNKEFPPGSPRRQELVDEGHAYSSL